jgi:N-acetylglucosaminyldiphosphoundecaprenol N-acetyl-beta-D-mannosaminyltransferase
MEFTRQTEAEFARDLAEGTVPAGHGARLVVTANLNHIVDLNRNAAFREAYRGAWRVTADGAPVAAYAQLRGAKLPGRLTGSGLFAQLMHRLDPARHSIYFLAPSEEVGRLCRDWLIARGFAEDAVVAEVPAFGFEKDEAASASLARRISAAGTSHLVLGVGAPKSEIWAHRHRKALGPCYVLCVGAGLEFFAGVKSRGPEWVRAAGFEWLWRFAQEPRRLFRRYFIDSWLFLRCVLDDLRGRPLLGEEPPREPR